MALELTKEFIPKDAPHTTCDLSRPTCPQYDAIAISATSASIAITNAHPHSITFLGQNSPLAQRFAEFEGLIMELKVYENNYNECNADKSILKNRPTEESLQKTFFKVNLSPRLKTPTY